jgi:HSP20 family protein
MVVRFSDPFETLLGLQRALESARSSDWFGLGTTSRGTFPPVNVFQQGDDFVVVTEIPGVNKSDLELKVKENQLQIAGKRGSSHGEGVSLHRRERRTGSFDRTVSFPAEIDAQGVKAEYRDGILAVFVPRAASAKPRTVSIT